MLNPNSDEDLDILLDRSPEAYAREQGWSAGIGAKGQTEEHTKDKINKGDKTAFEVRDYRLSFGVQGSFFPALAGLCPGYGGRCKQRAGKYVCRRRCRCLEVLSYTLIPS
jgi:hypothetical protein